MGANIKDLSDADFRKEVLESAQPVLVDFTAAWCAPCKAIAPALDELANEYSGRVKVTKLNIDDNQETAQQYGVRSVPTLLFFKGGKVVDQLVGAMPKAKIDERFKKLV